MRTTTDVLIVGAGPVGLMLAGELQRRGVDYVLVEREREPVPFCKALGVTPRTLEIWDQIGVLEHALHRGRFMAGFMALVEGRAATEERIALGSMPYGFLTISQFDTEAILRSHLQRHGGAPAVRLGTGQLRGNRSLRPGSPRRAGSDGVPGGMPIPGGLRWRPQHGAQGGGPRVRG